MKNVWIIGFPKSGNTWFSYLISYIFNMEFVDYEKQHARPKNETVRKLTSGQNENAESLFDGQLLKSHNKTSKKSDFVKDVKYYIIRDPRDCFVSYYHYFKSYKAGGPTRFIFNLLSLMGRKYQIRWFLNKWTSHVSNGSRKCSVIFKYESLLAVGESYLEDKLDEAGIATDPVRVRESFEHFSFSNLSGGRKPGEGDNTSFFRKGVSGDWVNFLQEDEVSIFDSAVKLYSSLN